MTAAALDLALSAPSGPTFVDYPLDVVFTEAELEVPALPDGRRREPAAGVEEAAALLAAAERPVIMAGTGLYWAHGEGELRALAEALGIPVFLNGLGRGCLPADHELAFSRARGTALQGADVALVIGVPMDFRLGFGGSFGEETKIVRLDVAPNALTANRAPEVDLVGDVAAEPGGDPRGGGRRAAQRRAGWSSCGEVEQERRAAEREELERRALAAAPGPRLQGAGGGPRPRRDRRRRRRRLRLLRGSLHRHLPAGLLDGPGAVRLPRRRAGPGDRRQGRPPRPAGLPAARRRRLRLRRDGVRHYGAPRARRRRA